MSDVRALITRLIAAGVDPVEAAVIVSEAAILGVAATKDTAAETSRQARNRRYYEAKRLKASESKTIKTDQDVSDAERLKASESDAEPRARVVYTSLPSLRSEELTSEANASSVDAACKTAPKTKPETRPPKSRGTRLPDDWEPSEADVEVARAEGLTDEEIHRAALEFRNFWSARSGSAATKLNWPRTWHNRVLEIGDRKRRYGPRLVAASGKSGGGGRGAVSFADIYARRHGAPAD